MNKAIKRFAIKVAVMGLMAFMVVGCGKHGAGDTVNTGRVQVKDTGIRYAEKFQIIWLSEAGVIYDDKNAGLVHLVTVDEGEDMVLCYDPNCKHIPATRLQPDPECMAAHFFEDTHTAYYEGSLYFFVKDSIFSHKIYKKKTDGAGRSLVAELPFGYDINKGCIFNGDKVYYLAKISHVDEITNSISFTLRVVEVDVLSGSYRFITEETKDLQLQMDMAEDTLYIRRAGVDDGQQYVLVVNVNTLENGFAVTKEKWADYACMGAYDNDSFFYIDRHTYDIGIRNIDGTVEQILVQGAEGENFGWPDVSCDGLFYQRTIDYGDEPIGYYFLDFITGEVTNVTDEQTKYGLFGYDGYYDAFVAHDGTFNNWTMWSKEKVLGEAKE